MVEHKRIEPEDLEVGMAVAYPYRVYDGYMRFFRCRIWKFCRVKRVTPMRTKVVLIVEHGSEQIEVNLKMYAVYEPDASMSHENEIVKFYKDSELVLSGYVNRKWRLLRDLSDDELKTVHGHLMALDAILNKEKRREEG